VLAGNLVGEAHLLLDSTAPYILLTSCCVDTSHGSIVMGTFEPHFDLPL
jgi:hypothetical protein